MPSSAEPAAMPASMSPERSGVALANRSFRSAKAQVVPPVAVVLVMQRWFVKGLTEGDK